MLSKKISEEMIQELFDLFISLKSREDCEILFEDLCTNKEIEQKQ